MISTKVEAPFKNIHHKLRILIVIFVFLVGFFGFVGGVEAAVYLHYADSTTNAKILQIYQEMGGAGGINDRWIRWDLKQYASGNGAWDVYDASIGRISTIALEINRDGLTYTNGSGDSGSWVDYATGKITAKRRDTATGYVPYSAYATYTATADYDDVYLGVHNNNGVNGNIRIKINDTISTSASDFLDSNGIYNEGGHYGNNAYPSWIHVASSVHAGDVIKIEIKDDVLPNNRHTITGLRFINNGTSINPGDTNWGFVGSKQFEMSATQMAVISGHVGSQTDTFMFGSSHPNHEYNPVLTLGIDGTAYTLGANLVLNQVVSGNAFSFTQTTTAYGNTQNTDDFGILTRRSIWQNNTQQQSWNLQFTNTFTANAVYNSMWPADYSFKTFRYADMGSNLNVLLPNNTGVNPNTYAGSSIVNGRNIFYGGDSNLKLTFETSGSVTNNFIYLVTGSNVHQKSYFENSNFEKQWVSGENLNVGTTTITLDYETPSTVDWNGKTLVISTTPTAISDPIDFIPFNNKGVTVKSLPSVGLTFSSLAPNKTYFTSRNDDSVGALELYSSHSSAKGSWTGISVSGAVDAVNNIINYSTTGLTLTSNASARNNTLYNNTTGINASNGSIVENNVFNSNTTNTTGAGTFNYNLYNGNTETNGRDENIYFPNSGAGNFGIVSTSTAIDAGTTTSWMTSTATDYAGHPIYGTPDIGAYEYQPPYTITTDHPQYSSNIRIYGDGKYRYTTATTSSSTANLSVIPVGGFPTYSASTTRPEYLNISDIVWGTSKQFTASSSIATSTIYTIGDLTPNTYYTINYNHNSAGTTTLASLQADQDGKITYTYTGGYSTVVFDISPDTSTATPGAIIFTNITQTGVTASTTATDTLGLATLPYNYHNITTGTYSGATSSPWVITGLTPNTTYTFEVGVQNSIGNWSTSTTQTVTTLAVPVSHSSSGGSASNQVSNLLAMGNYTLAREIAKQYGIIIPSNTLPQAPAIQAPANSSNPSSSFTRDLKLGMTGGDVKKLQQLLNTHGFPVSKKGAGSKGKETTKFGPATRSALIKYQKANKITPAVGYFGPVTRGVVGK